jgi:hypothetical protein
MGAVFMGCAAVLFVRDPCLGIQISNAELRGFVPLLALLFSLDREVEGSFQVASRQLPGSFQADPRQLPGSF